MLGGESSVPRPLQTCTCWICSSFIKGWLEKREKKVVLLVILKLEKVCEEKHITGGWLLVVAGSCSTAAFGHQ